MSEHRSWFIKLHRAIATPIRKVRRRTLKAPARFGEAAAGRKQVVCTVRRRPYTRGRQTHKEFER